MVATTDEDLETLAARESRESAEDAATGTVGDLLSRLEGQARLRAMPAARLCTICQDRTETAE